MRRLCCSGARPCIFEGYKKYDNRGNRDKRGIGLIVVWGCLGMPQTDRQNAPGCLEVATRSGWGCWMGSR